MNHPLRSAIHLIRLASVLLVVALIMVDETPGESPCEPVATLDPIT